MPLLSLLAPSRAQIDSYLVSREGADLNYPSPGSTQDAHAAEFKLPEGLLWQLDNTRVQVGRGRATYSAAKDHLKHWAQFQLPWSQVAADTPIAEGVLVAVQAKTLFLWSANPLKIVYVKDSEEQHKRGRRLWPGLGRHKQQQPLRWQFAHGCLQGHMLAGEESFRLEYNPADDTVWYQVLTFSRPVHPLAIVSYPITRFFQWRFAQDSAAALAAALSQGSETNTDKNGTHGQGKDAGNGVVDVAVGRRLKKCYAGGHQQKAKEGRERICEHPNGALMHDPVMAADGYTYERTAIERWLSSHDTSPMSNMPLEHKSLIPNFVLRSTISEYRTANGLL